MVFSKWLLSTEGRAALSSALTSYRIAFTASLCRSRQNATRAWKASAGSELTYTSCSAHQGNRAEDTGWSVTQDARPPGVYTPAAKLRSITSSLQAGEGAHNAWCGSKYCPGWSTENPRQGYGEWGGTCRPPASPWTPWPLLHGPAQHPRRRRGWPWLQCTPCPLHLAAPAWQPHPPG